MKTGAMIILLLTGLATIAQKGPPGVINVPAGDGWASTSVNVVVFRKNALTSFGDTQFIAYYNAEKRVVLGKRKLGTKQWQLVTTPYKGNAADAHNAISIIADGQGYLHLSWDHHNHPLHYCKSLRPGSLEMSLPMPMTGKKESRVTYPEFYRLPNGDLLFVYRDGGSGNGDLVMNRYITATQQWTRLQDNLVDGEGARSAYSQLTVDANGIIHLSWVWRETPDVASNHDMCYARSADGGITWERSDGTPYTLPITATTAEYACHIPQRSELINQTSMCADAAGNPYIATYWRSEESMVPQFRLIYLHGKRWKTVQVTQRTMPFSLSGSGTKRIPVSRPQVVVTGKGSHAKLHMIFRDEERGGKVSVASCTNLEKGRWQIRDLTDSAVGQWEPAYDPQCWQQYGLLHLFMQRVAQGDGEKMEVTPPSMVSVLEWKP